MLILVIMCIGIIVGTHFFPDRFKRANEYLQLACTTLLIFSMGVKLGQRENFFDELTTLGIQSFLFCLIPMVLSVLLVFVLTKRFMKDSDTKKSTETADDKPNEGNISRTSDRN